MSLLAFPEALALVLSHAAQLPLPGLERVSLLASAGRILAEDLLADRDQPAFDRATRDGFAVRAAEFSAGTRLRIAGQVRAGEQWSGAALAPGEAIEIMTGAPVPMGADAVAMIEHVVASVGWVTADLGRSLAAGDNIVPRGSEARQGALILERGTLVGAAEIALAATCGSAELAVYRRAQVAILATGDELVELDQAPEPWQIRNSNSYALAALVALAGGEPIRLAIAGDTLADLRARVLEARGSVDSARSADPTRSADLLLLSGGVSAGKYDFVEQVLAESGAEFFFTGVRMQPGKPVVFGRLPARDEMRACFFFGLPGNPISTQVTFHCFVQPLLRALNGAIQEMCLPRFVQATLSHAVAAKSELTRLLPAALHPDLVRPEVRLIPWQGSGDLAANARANGYAVLPDGLELRAGDVISVLLR